jgi:hypothetical protein
MVCDIRIKGHLGRHWADWFEGLAIALEENGETRLTGVVIDQAALHGLLRKVRDLGMPLLSVVCVQPDEAETSDGSEQMNDPLKANVEKTQ